jgi:hypothetical protein
VRPFPADCGSKAWVAGEKSPAAVTGTEPGVAQVCSSPLRHRPIHVRRLNLWHPYRRQLLVRYDETWGIDESDRVENRTSKQIALARYRLILEDGKEIEGELGEEDGQRERISTGLSPHGHIIQNGRQLLKGRQQENHQQSAQSTAPPAIHTWCRIWVVGQQPTPAMFD